MRRLLLVRHAPTSATRAAAFPADEPLDERGRADAALLAARLPARFELLSSPALRCVETAAGLGEPLVVRELAECDFGAWAGRSLIDVHESDPEAAAGWMTDHDFGSHGGETLRAFAARVAGWLDAQASLDGRAVAVTHGGVVKAAVAHALGAPLDAFWRIDVSPLSLTELHAHDGRWTVTRVNCLAARVVADSPRYAGTTRHDRAGEGPEAGAGAGRDEGVGRGEGAGRGEVVARDEGAGRGEAVGQHGGIGRGEVVGRGATVGGDS